MRYPEEITLEVRNEEPDKKRRFTDASGFETLSKDNLHRLILTIQTL